MDEAGQAKLGTRNGGDEYKFIRKCKFPLLEKNTLKRILIMVYQPAQ
jgi:hypothetical protein